MAFLPLKIFRRDSDAVLGTDGDSQSLYNNAIGRLKVSSTPAAYAAVNGTITTTTSTVTADVTRAGAATIMVSGTYAGVNFAFEASVDGTNFVAIPVQPISLTNALVTSTGVLTNQTLAWDVTPLLGIISIRVRATAYTSGTANIVITPSAVAVENATQVNGTVAVSGVSSITPGTAGANLGKAEDILHVNGDVGVFSLGVRNDTLTTVTSGTGDYTQLSTDRSGSMVTTGAPRELKARQATVITSSTTETTIITAIAATFNDLYGLTITNTSTTATEVIIRDATAGGTQTSFFVPASDTRGFMLPVDSAIPQATVNNNWTATCGTSVASIKITALYVKRV